MKFREPKISPPLLSRPTFKMEVLKANPNDQTHVREAQLLEWKTRTATRVAPHWPFSPNATSPPRDLSTHTSSSYDPTLS